MSRKKRVCRTRLAAVVPAFLCGWILASPAVASEKTHAHPNHLSGFVGYSNASGNKEGIKIGAEYEYRFAERFGVGATVDYLAGDVEAMIVTGGFTWYPAPSTGLWTALALGGKFKSHKNLLLGRILIGYDFHIGGFSVGPLFNADFTEDGHDNLSIGISFGKGF